ncbi:hypothetical protein ES695_07265 [Candidatus Atribacteria bacterium 1244-E10-H5-B2]|nr:MAG: hypothetical protein ES695_07265 [Candidatus Atribacteria bacterium 1244-E10-H5-B2]
MRNLEEKELKGLKELEKLTIDELKEKRTESIKENISRNEMFRVTRGRLEIAIRTRELIGIYEKYGFEGLYIEGKESWNPNRIRESVEDDIPF